MAYKDKEKQKQAQRERQRRYRAKEKRRDKIRAKGVTKTGCDNEGVTDKGVTQNVIPEQASHLTLPEGVTFEEHTGVKARPDMQATEVDYLMRQASDPQTQRPHNRPEPVQEGQTQEIQ